MRRHARVLAQAVSRDAELLGVEARRVEDEHPDVLVDDGSDVDEVDVAAVSLRDRRGPREGRCRPREKNQLRRR